MPCAWKPNWEETKQHFIQWWQHQGLVFNTWEAVNAGFTHEVVEHPGESPDIDFFYTQPRWRALWNHYVISRQTFPGDILPVATTDIGPGSLALLMGGDAILADDTVWFLPTMNPLNPETLPPLHFTTQSKWWHITEATLTACAELAKGKYTVGCPDLVENVDIVAALRSPELLLMDMVERPDWVVEKVWEVNQIFFDVYNRIYDIIKLDDGSSVFGAFRLWGPGKVAKVQCDTSAMFSPAMFSKFVVPALTEQCEWLDYSMFHLDGHQCIKHLDLLLEIDALDAIEWTPDPQVPGGGHPTWYPMYQRILNAGKSVQAIGVKPEEVESLLDVVGGKGMYIMTTFKDRHQAEMMNRMVESYR
jgi:hypothetical protein